MNRITVLSGLIFFFICSVIFCFVATHLGNISLIVFTICLIVISLVLLLVYAVYTHEFPTSSPNNRSRNSRYYKNQGHRANDYDDDYDDDDY